jgi:hypothetical protein
MNTECALLDILTLLVDIFCLVTHGKTCYPKDMKIDSVAPAFHYHLQQWKHKHHMAL